MQPPVGNPLGSGKMRGKFVYRGIESRRIAFLELTSVVLYLIPQIAILGGIVLTGYLGGAICTHVRLGEPPVIHVVIELLIWGGLYWREPRLRAILPIRKPIV